MIDKREADDYSVKTGVRGMTVHISNCVHSDEHSDQLKLGAGTGTSSGGTT